MEEMKEKIHAMKIVPVVKLNDAKDAVPLAKALVEGGIPCAEVTFRTDAAVESIKNAGSISGYAGRCRNSTYNSAG